MSVFLVKAQEETIVFKFFNESEGLPNNAVFKIFQDRSDIMWFGGDNGLVRYNGFDFQTFRYDINRPDALVSNKIRIIKEDNGGRLWVGTSDAGICLTGSYKREFQRLKYTPSSSEGNISSSITDIEIDDRGRIWVVGDKGIHILEEKEGVFSMLPIYELASISKEVIDTLDPKVLLFDPSNGMWIGTANGVCLLNSNEKSYVGPQNNSKFPTREVDDIVKNQKGEVWFSFKGGESRFSHYLNGEKRFEKFTDLKINSRRGRLHFTFDKDNRLWASAFGDRVYGWDFDKSRQFLDSKKNSNITKERFMRRPFVDRAGNVWVPGLGFYKYDYSRGFKNYQHAMNFHQSNTAIFVEDDGIWLAYREAGFIHVSDEKTFHYQQEEAGQYKIPTNHVREFVRLKDGRMAATGMSRLLIFNEMTGKHTVTRLKGISRGLFQDSRGVIYVGGFDGLVVVSSTGEVIRTYTLPPNLGETRNFIQGIVEDADGFIWFGSQILGLARLNPETHEIKQYLPDRGKFNIHSTRIVDLAIGRNNILWIATDMGLVKMEIPTEKFTTYTQKDGLSSDYVFSVLVSDDGKVYGSTTAGITEFDPRTESFRNYNQTDGLLNRSYYPRTKYYHDGTIYFGGVNGVDFFRPSDIRPTFKEPSPRFFNIKINNKHDLPIDSILEAGILELNYSEDLVEFEFGATNYEPNEEISYQYKMPELVENWVNLGDQRRILFADLPSGAFELKIRAHPIGKAMSTEELTLSVEVSTPIWETIWFRLGLLMVGLLGFIYFIRSREARARAKEQRESQIKQTILQLEKKALLAQMNPHFIYNSMNAIQQFMSEQNYESAMRYLTKFSRLLRQLLNNSAQNKIAIDQEIQLIVNYLALEDLRFENRFEHSIHVSPGLDTSHIMIPPFLIQPHVEQAVRLSLANNAQIGKVKLSITRAENFIRVLIEDNGPAVDPFYDQAADDHATEGISIVEERLKHINQDLGTQKVRTELLKDYEDKHIGRRVELLVDIN